MNISLAWLNSLLNPGNVSADEAERLLTFIGFPIESKTVQPSGDTLLDVEVTSNRGDCLCHVGVAREVAAASKRALLLPSPATIAPLAGDGPHNGGRLGNGAASIGLENRIPDGCPLFTVRLIRGVKVGPSPDWLVKRLEAVGQRSINNVVDITNYVQFEMGNPTHVFDLAKIRPDAAGARTLIVRGAEKGEKLKLLDGKVIELRPGEMVVADGAGVSSLAGIMGGEDSGVTATTTDVVIEVATWAPGLIRKAARRLALRTDASHRFERFVDTRTVDAASRRIAQLVLELAGGTLESSGASVLAAGKPVASSPSINFRPSRSRQVLGAGFTDDQMRTALSAQGVTIGNAGGEQWMCTPPAHRPDIKREIDLIEEVARTIGLDKIPLHDKLAVRVAPPQQSEVAARELTRVLTGLGFFETVTVGFVSAKEAKPFTASGSAVLSVSDQRRKDDGILRPSVIPSLLACRRANLHAKSAPDGSVRLFELAPAYATVPEGTPGRNPAGHAELRTLTLIADAPTGATAPGVQGTHARKQAAVRLMRATIDSLVVSLLGHSAKLTVASAKPPIEAMDAGAFATIAVNGEPIGSFGLLADTTLKQFELEMPIVAAVLDAPMLLAHYPPKETVNALPLFPFTERDLSLVVEETLAWAKVEELVALARPKQMESLHFVGTYRGKPLEEGKKSVTLRMVFRNAERTLRDDEVNAEMDQLIARAKSDLRATVRA